MKSFVCLIAVACAVSLVSAQAQGEIKAKMFPENESGIYKSHEEIEAALKGELSPEKITLLVSSYDPTGPYADLIEYNRVRDHACSDMGLALRKGECDQYAQEEEGSDYFKNLNRYCHAATEKVFEFCADKMEEFESVDDEDA